jgi:hypothetical protein
MQITWKVAGMTVMPTLDDKTNVVVRVNCLISAIDGDFKASTSMGQSLKLDDGQQFVDYQSLTEEKVLEWVKTQGAEELAQAENFVQKVIENQKNPSVVAIEKPLPWLK